MKWVPSSNKSSSSSSANISGPTALRASDGISSASFAQLQDVASSVNDLNSSSSSFSLHSSSIPGSARQSIDLSSTSHRSSSKPLKLFKQRKGSDRDGSSHSSLKSTRNEVYGQKGADHLHLQTGATSLSVSPPSLVPHAVSPDGRASFSMYRANFNSTYKKFSQSMNDLNQQPRGLNLSPLSPLKRDFSDDQDRSSIMSPNSNSGSAATTANVHHHVQAFDRNRSSTSGSIGKLNNSGPPPPTSLDLSVLKEGWLNRADGDSKKSSNGYKVPHWKLQHAAIKDNLMLFYKPSSDVALKFFDVAAAPSRRPPVSEPSPSLVKRMYSITNLRISI